MIKFEHLPTGKTVTINTKYITSYEFETVNNAISLNILMSNGYTYKFNLALLRGYRQVELESSLEKTISINNSRVENVYYIASYELNR